MVEEKYLCTDIKEIPKMVTSLRKNFYSMTPTSSSYRVNQIKQILKFLEENETDLLNACIHYYGGNAIDHFLLRLWLLKNECHLYIKNLSNWMKPQPKPQSFPLNLMWSAQTEYHPFGVTTIIAPWNYPIQLLIRPLIGAIAAGNAVILKPSEITDQVTRVIHDKLLKYLDPNMVQIVCGGATETTALLQQKLDFCLFTGGGSIGKIIMNACSSNLIPCCLELGGKNPVIIDDDCDLDTSLKRLIWGKFDFNGAQTCVAPEYVFISKDKQAEAVEIIRKYLVEFYGDGATKNIGSYFNIVNKRHFERLRKLRKYYLENKPQKIAVGGAEDEQFGTDTVDEETRHLPPMVLKDIDFNNDKIMEEEVFGPILSIIPMDGKFTEWKDDVLTYIRSKDQPLACYIFTRQPKSKDVMKLRNCISTGTMCLNDTIIWMGLKGVPFGGVGGSGMGRYGGIYSFKTFSQERPVCIRSHGTEFLNNDRYPNASLSVKEAEKKAEQQKRLMESLYPKQDSMLMKLLKYSVVVGGIVGFAYYYKKYKR